MEANLLLDEVMSLIEAKARPLRDLTRKGNAARVFNRILCLADIFPCVMEASGTEVGIGLAAACQQYAEYTRCYYGTSVDIALHAAVLAHFVTKVQADRLIRCGYSSKRLRAEFAE